MTERRFVIIPLLWYKNGFFTTGVDVRYNDY